MKKANVCIGVLLLLSLLMTLRGANPEFPLAVGGKAVPVIYVSPKALPAERHAAEELSKYLKLATGAAFPVSDSDSSSAAVRILVGPDAAGLAGFDLNSEKLGRDGILIRQLGNNLIIAGNRPRGTLYAVYTFLEGKLGFRFWAGKQTRTPVLPDGKRGTPIHLSDAETDCPPVRNTLSVKIEDIVHTPQFELREPYFGTFLGDPDFCVQRKMIGRISETGDENSIYGGKIRIDGHIQSFWYWIPPEKYFSSHPEFFSEIDGVRNWQNPKGKLWADRQTQLCMSNLELADEIARLMLDKWKLVKGRIDGFSFAPNDWKNPCQCAACRKIYKQEGAESGAFLLLVNRIAEKLAAHDPSIRLHIGAYMWYQEPPLHIRPHKNVVVWFVTSDVNLCESMYSPRNRPYLERLQKWADICRESQSQLYVWDHGANWAHYLIPFPDLDLYQEKIRLYRDLNVKGVWFLGTYSSTNMEFAVLRNYLMSKLLWDPSLEVQPLLDRTLTEYYRAAAPFIREYIAAYHKAYRDSAQSFDSWLWSPFEDCRFLSPKLIFDSFELIEKAADAVRGNPALEIRVQRVRMSLLYLFCIRYDELKAAASKDGRLWPFPQGMAALVQEFEGSLERLGMSNIAEGPRSCWPIVADRARQGENPIVPAQFRNLPVSHFSGVTPQCFQAPGGAALRLEDDPQALGGKALVLTSRPDEPQFMLPLWNVPVNIRARESKAPVRIYLKLQCDFRKKQGPAFRASVTSRSASLVRDAKEISGSGYQWYDMGRIENPADWIHLLLKVPANENILSIKVGGVYFKMEQPERK